MWEEITNLAIQNGLFAVLFLGLLIYLLKDSSKREKKYQQTIESLNKHLDIVENIEKDVGDIKQEIKYKPKRAKKETATKWWGVMKKIFNYNFLMTVLASVVVLLEVLVNVLKLNINIDAVISISVAIIGVMVTLGIVSKDKSDKNIETKEDLQDLLDDKKDNNNENEKEE